MSRSVAHTGRLFVLSCNTLCPTRALTARPPTIIHQRVNQTNNTASGRRLSQGRGLVLKDLPMRSSRLQDQHYGSCCRGRIQLDSGRTRSCDLVYFDRQQVVPGAAGIGQVRLPLLIYVSVQQRIDDLSTVTGMQLLHMAAHTPGHRTCPQR